MNTRSSLELSLGLSKNEMVLPSFVEASRQLVHYVENMDMEDEHLVFKTMLALTYWYTAGLKATRESCVGREDSPEKVVFEQMYSNYMHAVPIGNQNLWYRLQEDLTALYREMRIEFFKIDNLASEASIASAIETMEWNFYDHQQWHTKHMLLYLDKM